VPPSAAAELGVVRRFASFKTLAICAKLQVKRSALSASAAQTATGVPYRKGASNKSLDARRMTHFHRGNKLLFEMFPARVNSALDASLKKDKRNVKNNKSFCAGRKRHSVVCGSWFPATPRLTSRWT
jgi:hypothetical protein